MFLEDLRKENPTKTNPRGWLVLKRPEVAGFQAPGDIQVDSPCGGRMRGASTGLAPTGMGSGLCRGKPLRYPSGLIGRA